MINYSVTMRANPMDENAPKKAYAQAQSLVTLDLSAFAKHISDHGSVYDEGDIANILSKSVRCLRENLLSGNRVNLGDLGTFSVSLQSKGADSAKDFTSANITAVNVNWTPGPNFADLLKDAQFNPVPTRKATAKLLAAQKAGETVVDLTDVESDSTNGGNGNTNTPGNNNTPGSNDTPAPTPTLYTLTWKHNGTVQRTDQLAEGAAIAQPAAPEEGYHWKDVPTTMPGHALEIVSEADAIDNEPPSLT